MAWFKVDDKLADHRKVRKLGRDKLPAMGLWTLCGSWAADELSDGFVPEEIAARFDPDLRYAARLVEVGLWETDEEDGEAGFRFHEWTDHQPSKDQVLERRRADADRRAKWRNAKRNGATRPGPDAGQAESSRPESQQGSRRDTPRESQPESRPGSVLPVPTRPDPSLSSPSPSPRNSRSLLAGVGIDDDEEITKILELIHAEHPGIRSEVAYVAKVIANGDIDLIRERAAQQGQAGERPARYTEWINGNRHDFQTSEVPAQPDSSCTYAGCGLPAGHPIHKRLVAVSGGNSA